MQAGNFRGQFTDDCNLLKYFLKTQDGLMDGRMDRYVINKYKIVVKYRW